jgi:hypothetical protein
MAQEPVKIAVSMNTLQSPPPTNIHYYQGTILIYATYKYIRNISKSEVRTADPTHLHSKSFERNGEKGLKMVDKQRSLEYPQSFSVSLDSSLPHR